MTLIPSLPSSPARPQGGSAVHKSHTHTHRGSLCSCPLCIQNTGSLRSWAHVCVRTHISTQEFLLLTGARAAHSQQTNSGTDTGSLASCLPLHTHVDTCACTCCTRVCALCMYVVHVCLCTCACACTIAQVCMHTHTKLIYTVKSSPTMCLAGGTGQENHIFGISGLPALSGLLLPVSALRQPQEVSVSLAAKFQSPLTPRETETAPASCEPLSTMYPPQQPHVVQGDKAGLSVCATAAVAASSASPGGPGPAC